MKQFVYVIIITAGVFSNALAADHKPTQKQPMLSAKANALLKSVLSERFKAHDEEYDMTGRFIKQSEHSKIFYDRFYSLLSNHEEAATEAVAALLCFYMGEHSAEELICESVRRSKTIKPYLVRFINRPPITGLEPIKRFYTNIPNLRREVLDLIKAGKKPSDICNH
jgi:hypothetical protein